jgi:hypothetical protein
MSADQPSRRQILAGFFAGLFAWLWAAKARPEFRAPAAPSLDRAESMTSYSYSWDPGSPGEDPLIWTFTYDAVGRCTSWTAPAPPLKAS